MSRDASTFKASSGEPLVRVEARARGYRCDQMERRRRNQMGKKPHAEEAGPSLSQTWEREYFV